MTRQLKKQNILEKIIKPLLGIGVILVLLFAIPAINNNKNDRNVTESEIEENNEQKQNESSMNEVGGHVISESAAEDKCQDASILGKYLNLDDIKIIQASNYNFQYSPMPGEYDNERNTLVYTSWNGWDKKANQRMVFACWVSGPNDDEIIIHYLKVSNDTGESIDLVGSSDFTVYDASGQPEK